MNETLMLAASGMAGLGLGGIFFGGLWWTVRRGLASPRPVLWFLGGTLLRRGIVMAGFYGVADGRWQRLLMCLLGFVVARQIVTWLTRPVLGQEAGRTTPSTSSLSPTSWGRGSQSPVP